MPLWLSLEPLGYDAAVVLRQLHERQGELISAVAAA